MLVAGLRVVSSEIVLFRIFSCWKSTLIILFGVVSPKTDCSAQCQANRSKLINQHLLSKKRFACLRSSVFVAEETSKFTYHKTMVTRKRPNFQSSYHWTWNIIPIVTILGL